MRKFITIVAALGFLSTPALAKAAQAAASTPAKPAKAMLKDGILIPAGSPLRLVSVTRGPEVNATFNGQVEISGIYEIQLYGEEVFATLWPDAKSRQALPSWDGRGDVDEIFIANSMEFTKAVVSSEELAKLKAGRLPLIRGQATIIADQYETGIECDATHFSARFVSVVKNVEVAGEIGSGGEC